MNWSCYLSDKYDSNKKGKRVLDINQSRVLDIKKSCKTSRAWCLCLSICGVRTIYSFVRVYEYSSYFVINSFAYFNYFVFITFPFFIYTLYTYDDCTWRWHSSMSNNLVRLLLRGRDMCVCTMHTAHADN